MKGKLLGFAVALLAAATVGAVQLQTKAAVDTTRDCDQYAVVYCGTLTPAEARNKYDQKDHAKIFGAMGISKGDLSGSFKNGVVYKDGRVVVDGKTVATGATMAARNLGGTPIAGTGASKVSVSAMGSAQTAFVKFDQNGRFLFAVMKPCGNPVVANPVKPPKPEPKPSAECKSLTARPIGSSENRYRLVGAATVKNGAKVRAYDFTVSRNGKEVFSDVVRTSETEAKTTFTASRPGTYTAKLVVRTTEGQKTAQRCTATFTIEKPENPPTPQKTPMVSIEKLVENVKYKRVGVDVEFDYQIKVTNEGDTVLKNVEVTDTPEDGITLNEQQMVGTVEDNVWTYTIPELNINESMDFTLTAKVPVFLAGKLTNTVCVDAPEVPGNPDDCDTADVDVPPHGKVLVCEPETGDTISVDEEDADKYPPVGSPECEEQPIDNPKADTPKVLPETGPVDTLLQAIGAMSLVGSATYYIASRRQVL